eukprot:5848133-Heterocapsa_arctica.AAC.2
MASSGGGFTVATYNIRALATNIVGALHLASLVAADVVCFQEADIQPGGEDAVRAAAGAAGYGHAVFGRMSGDVIRVVTVSRFVMKEWIPGRLPCHDARWVIAKVQVDEGPPVVVGN